MPASNPLPAAAAAARSAVERALHAAASGMDGWQIHVEQAASTLARAAITAANEHLDVAARRLLLSEADLRGARRLSSAMAADVLRQTHARLMGD